MCTGFHSWWRSQDLNPGLPRWTPKPVLFSLVPTESSTSIGPPSLPWQTFTHPPGQALMMRRVPVVGWVIWKWMGGREQSPWASPPLESGRPRSEWLLCLPGDLGHRPSFLLSCLLSFTEGTESPPPHGLLWGSSEAMCGSAPPCSYAGNTPM